MAKEPDKKALEPIKAICSGAVSYRIEGWRQLIHMQGLHLYVDGVEKEMDGVLCLNHNNQTYPTKLYLSDAVGSGVNWNEQAYILGRNWHTFSWSGVSPDLLPMEILAAHLAPLNKARAA